MNKLSSCRLNILWGRETRILSVVVALTCFAFIDVHAQHEMVELNNVERHHFMLRKKEIYEYGQAERKPDLNRARRIEGISQRFKNPQRAISSVNTLVGPAIIQTLNEEDPLFGGNSAQIKKLNNSTIAISNFIDDDDVNDITATIDIDNGEISVPTGQVLVTTQYGDVKLAYLSGNMFSYETPLTGIVAEDGILLTTSWIAILEYNGSYYAYRGPWLYTLILKANGNMKAIRQASSSTVEESYNVYISQNETNDSIFVANFGNNGADAVIIVNDDQSVFLPAGEILYDVRQEKDDDGNVTQDDYISGTWNSLGSITQGDATGTVSEKQLNLGRWCLYDLCSKTAGFYNSAQITFSSSSDRFYWPNNELIKYRTDEATYMLDPNSKTGTIVTVKMSYDDLVIPESVTYNGTSYSITAIAEQALASETDFNESVSLPSTITTVADGAFDYAETSAIIWNSNTPLPANAFAKVDKDVWKNMLLYVKKEGIAPSSFANTIVNNVAQNIELHEGAVFHCPQQFTARNISFTHEFTMKTVIGTKQGWETISLPFDVMSITHATKGRLLPFASYSPSSDNKPFWLYEWTSSGFVKASSMQANKPYLISMPNNTAYADEYNVAGSVTFAATNVIVHTTKNEDIRSNGYNNKYFFAQYYFRIINSDDANINSVNNLHNEQGGYNPGSIFIKNMRDTFPFEGYMVEMDGNAVSNELIDIEFADDEPTGIESVLSINNRALPTKGIYTVSGMRVTADEGLSEEDVLKHLPAGVYLVNGKKRIVK